MVILGAVSLYPMFDNEAGLGFDFNEFEYMDDKEESDDKIFNTCMNLKTKHIVPGDSGYSNVKDVIEYIFKKYPDQALISYKKVNSFSFLELDEYLQQFTELSETRKEMAKKFFIANSVIFNRIAQKIISDRSLDYKIDS